MKTKTQITIWLIALFICAGGNTDAQASKMNGHQCMTMHHSKDADANFIRDMIPHHQMAVDMAEKELKNGKDPKAREMAEKILDAQKREIADMQKWLSKH